MSFANPLPYDVNGRPIQGVKEVAAIANTSINGSSYTLISVPAGIFCKTIMVKTRDGGAWRLATSETPSTYMKITGIISLNLSLEGGNTIFYVRGDSTSDVLEIMFLD